MRTLEAGVVTLEPQVAGHAAQMFAVLSDARIYEFENEPPASEEWLRERFRKLESRRSPDGKEEWLNWVLKLRDGSLAGYVQATVRGDASADVAYVLSSAHWGRGIASRAVGAMMDELSLRHGTRVFFAVFKTANGRSRRLLERLGFEPAAAAEVAARGVEPGESLMRHAG